MATKLRQVLVSLPQYTSKGSVWREAIWKAALASVPARTPGFVFEIPVEVVVVVALKDRGKARKQDPDNLLKHILDALQGHIEGPKSSKRSDRIVRNDALVYRACIQKQYVPKGDEAGDQGGGMLLIREFRERSWEELVK